MIIMISAIRNLISGTHNLDENGYPKTGQLNGVKRNARSSQNIKRGFKERYYENDAVLTRHFNEYVFKNIEDEDITLLDVNKIMKIAVPSKSSNKNEKEGKEDKEKKSDKKKENIEKEVLFYHAKTSAPEIAKIVCEHINVIRNGNKEELKKVSELISDVISKNIAPTIALLGRMSASKPEFNIDGSMFVAQAISTHKKSIEDDFYSAKDDLLDKSQSGAGMMGYKHLYSACMFEHYSIDLNSLESKLGGDKEKVKNVVLNSIKAIIFNHPITGIHNSASFSPARLCLVSVGKFQHTQMVDAFNFPVQENYISESIKCLNFHCPKYFKRFLDPEFNDFVNHVSFGADSLEEYDFLASCEEHTLRSFINKVGTLL